MLRLIAVLSLTSVALAGWTDTPASKPAPATATASKPASLPASKPARLGWEVPLEKGRVGYVGTGKIVKAELGTVTFELKTAKGIIRCCISADIRNLRKGDEININRDFFWTGYESSYGWSLIFPDSAEAKAFTKPNGQTVYTTSPKR